MIDGKSSQPAGGMQINHMIGSIISLITNAQVRYEGTLVAVDQKERSMHLTNVRNYGSEGRREGIGEIPAPDNIIANVVFKVDHIKDFKIIKRPEKKEEPVQMSDPAIISSSKEQPRKKDQGEW